MTSSSYPARVLHLIESGAFTRQSLPYPMPRRSSLEAEVEKIWRDWMATRQNQVVAISPITYLKLYDRFHGGETGLLASIAEHSGAIRTFSYYPSSLGPLEIRDSEGVVLGYRFKIEPALLDTLRESDTLLPDRTPRRRGGGGDPEARGVFDTRHYAIWADYMHVMKETKEIHQDQPASGTWLAQNMGLFKAMSHELRMRDPEQYVRLTGAVTKQMLKYKSRSGEVLKPVAGAWHGVCINRGQTGDVSVSHQDWMDLPSSYNAVAPYGDGFTGGDLILWQLKMRVQVLIGEGFMFMGAIIAHKVTEITSGVRNSIDLFVHKSTFDVLDKANARAGIPKWGKKEKKKRREKDLKQSRKEHQVVRKGLREDKRERQKGSDQVKGKCLG